MESVGQKLREARSRLGLTLDQVSAHTRINLKNLSAIETDDVSRISSPFIYRSFVRQFAAEVKVDYETIAKAVQEAVSTMPEPLVPGQLAPGQTEAEPIHVARIKPKRERKLTWLRSVVSFSVMMAACTGLYAAWQNSHSNWHTLVGNVSGEIAGLRTTLSSVALRGHSTRSAKPAQSRAAVKGNATGEPATAGFHIELSAIERSWLSIVADGKEIFNGVLDASETKVLEGHESARIRTGNAGGLSFVFNGKEIGILGPRGSIRTVVFTKDNYQVLQTVPQVAFISLSQSAE